MIVCFLICVSTACFFLVYIPFLETLAGEFDFPVNLHALVHLHKYIQTELCHVFLLNKTDALNISPYFKMKVISFI